MPEQNEQNRKTVNPVIQNLIVGSLFGITIAVGLRFLFMKTGGAEWAWLVFFLIGPLIGFLSGNERKRYENLKSEKNQLASNLGKIQDLLKKSANKYHLIMENLSDAIYLTTEEGRFLLFNQALSLLSGYSPAQLKSMQLKQLQVDGEKIEDIRKAWLDNGICRYETRWKNKEGLTLFLEVSAKWIKIAGKQLILHTARDIQKRKLALEDMKIHELIASQKEQLKQLTYSHQVFYSQILGKQGHTLTYLRDLTDRNGQEKAHAEPLLKAWQNTEKFTKELVEKNARDLDTSHRPWNINGILCQELAYLERMTDLKGFSIQTWFAPDLPGIKGYGPDFSLAFGTILRAALRSMEAPRRREISITTNLKEGGVHIEIQAPTAIHFHEHLCSVVDPGYVPDPTEQRSIGATVAERLFQAFGAKIGISEAKDKGVVIRVVIPAASQQNQTMKTADSATPKESGPIL